MITGIHPFADMFPMLPESEHVELRESIRANGLRNAIVTTPDGLVIDGRNRWKACKELGLDPDIEVYEGDDIAEYVIDCNSTRRHMSTGARAMATALVLAADGRRKDGKWDNPGGRGKKGDGIPSGLSRNTWREAMAQAGVVIDTLPELAAQVVNGDLSLDAAYRRAEAKRAEEREQLAEAERIEAEEEDARTKLAEHAPELIKKIGQGKTYSSARVAFTAWEDANRKEAARLRKEKEAKARQQAEYDKAWTSTYTTLAEHIVYLSAHSDDVPKLMERYERRFINPPQLLRDLTPDRIAKAVRLLEALKNWDW